MPILASTCEYSRRRFLALVGASACIPLLPGCIKKNQSLTIGVHVWPGYEPLSLASSLGWLDENLIKLVQTKSATDSIKHLEQGELDGAGLTLDEVLRVREMGIPLSVVLVCDVSAGADQFLVRPDIKTLADIKGRRIAVEEGALGALMLYQVLQAGHLKQQDIITVPLSAEQHADAWRHGKIDAAVTYEPASVEIAGMGGERLFDSSQCPDLIVDVFAIRSDILNYAHSDALHHFVNAHLKALNYLQRNVDDATYRMAPRFQLPPEQVMATFKGMVLPDLDNNIRMLDSSQASLLNSARIIADIMFEAGILHQPAELSGLIHAEYLPQNL